MIKFPPKDKLKDNAYFLVFIHFVNYEQKSLLGKFVIFTIVVLTFDTLIVKFFGLYLKQEEAVTEVDLISTETKRQ